MDQNLQSPGLPPDQRRALLSFGSRLSHVWEERLRELAPSLEEATRRELLEALGELASAATLNAALEDALSAQKGADPAAAESSVSALDLAKRHGFVGGVNSGHADYASNPVHMEGFGR